jgi:uncharacterized membrane protein YccC
MKSVVISDVSWSIRPPTASLESDFLSDQMRSTASRTKVFSNLADEISFRVCNAEGNRDRDRRPGSPGERVEKETMPLRRKNTWSQQTLEVERHLAGVRETGFLTADKRAMLLLAAKTALAAGLCYWLATLAHLSDGYWGSISAIIVLQSNVGSTVTASRDRLLGTLIGAAFGAGFSFFDSGQDVLLLYLMAVVLAMVTCSLLGLKNSSRLAGVTVTIILLVHRTGSNWTLPMHRVLEVLLGIVVALLFSTLVLPSRARVRLRERLAHEYLLLGALFDARMSSFEGGQVENLSHIQKDVQAAISTNATLLDAARNEPAGGPASIESLSLLHQFGMQFEAALSALALAGEGSSSNGASQAPIERKSGAYAAQLEPQLSKLTVDIRAGFQYVAGCIHRWRFDSPPEDIDLEADITALEAKMAEIRPRGLEFPQEEILRVYAVQLHLKQLARLLRSARVETDSAIQK